MSEKVAVKSIRLDGGTQSRAEIDNDVVTDYAYQMKAGVEFPPIVVFFDGSEVWCADGFHRVQAARRVNIQKIAAIVKQGNLRDAILYSCGANADHGLRRSNADKRRAVMRLLEDDEWRAWSNAEIARRCSVSHTFVNELRSSLETASSENESRTYKTKHGGQSTMQTGNIGKSVRYESDAEADDETPDGFTKISYARRGTKHGEYNFTDDGDPIIYEDSFYAADYVKKRVIVEPFPSKDACWAKYHGLQAVSGVSFLSSPMLQKCEYFAPDVYAHHTAQEKATVAGSIESAPVTPEPQALFAEPPTEDGDTQKFEPPPPTEPEQLPFTGEEPNDPDPFESGEYEVTPFGRKPKRIEAKPESSTVSPISAEAGSTIDTATSLREIAAKLSNSGPDTPLSGWESKRLVSTGDAQKLPAATLPAPTSINWLSLLPPQLVSTARTVLTDVDCADPLKTLHGRVLVGFGGEHTQATMLALQALSGNLITALVSGRISQAILIAPAWTSDVWFGNLWAHPICFCRVPMKLPTANGEALWAEEAVAVTYFGHNIMGFAEEFDPHGPVVFSNRMLRRIDVDITDFFAENEAVQ